jgi:hypothetical protein
MYINHYAARTAVAEWLKLGRKDMFTSVNLTSDKLKELGVELGQFFEVDNVLYRAVRARSTVTAKGYILKSYMNAAARTGTANVASTKAELVTADTFVKGDLDGGYVWFDSGTDGGRRRIISNGAEAGASKVKVAKKNQALRNSAIEQADAFTNQPDGTSTYKIHCDWEVEQTSAATDLVTCVSLGAVTDGYLTIVAVEGPYVDIFIDGNDAGKNGVAGAKVCPSATAGVAIPETQAGITAAEAATFFAQMYDAYTGAGAIRTCRLFSRFAIGGQRLQYVN